MRRLQCGLFLGLILIVFVALASVFLLGSEGESPNIQPSQSEVGVEASDTATPSATPLPTNSPRPSETTTPTRSVGLSDGATFTPIPDGQGGGPDFTETPADEAQPLGEPTQEVIVAIEPTRTNLPLIQLTASAIAGTNQVISTVLSATETAVHATETEEVGQGEDFETPVEVSLEITSIQLDEQNNSVVLSLNLPEIFTELTVIIVDSNTGIIEYYEVITSTNVVSIPLANLSSGDHAISITGMVNGELTPSTTSTLFSFSAPTPDSGAGVGPDETEDTGNDMPATETLTANQMTATQILENVAETQVALGTTTPRPFPTTLTADQEATSVVQTEQAIVNATLGTLPASQRTATKIIQDATAQANGTFTPTSAQIPEYGGGGCAKPVGWTDYFIQAGDTLPNIAERVGISLAELMQGNCFENPVIPDEAAAIYVPQLPEEIAQANSTEFEVVDELGRVVGEGVVRLLSPGSILLGQASEVLVQIQLYPPARDEQITLEPPPSATPQIGTPAPTPSPLPITDMQFVEVREEMGAVLQGVDVDNFMVSAFPQNGILKIDSNPQIVNQWKWGIRPIGEQALGINRLEVMIFIPIVGRNGEDLQRPTNFIPFTIEVLPSGDVALKSRSTTDDDDSNLALIGVALLGGIVAVGGGYFLLTRRPRRKIFISYRRADSQGFTGRIYDRLAQKFGDANVFMDVEAIEYGENFVQAIEDAVGHCDILIAVIGRYWVDMTNDAGTRRIDDPEDFVRLEIASALKKGVRVIPSLVNNAEMPAAKELPDELRELSLLNAISLRNDSFDYDM